jgi:hypothetical protein
VKKQQRKTEKLEKPSQLDLGIKEPLINKFFKIKGNIDFTILKFEVKKFLKDPLVWAAFVISIILIAQQILLTYKNIAEMPSYLPIYRYFISIPKKLVNKEYIFLFPGISITTLVVSFVFTSRYYNSEKLLTKFLLFSLLLCVLSQTIILIDLVKFS